VRKNLLRADKLLENMSTLAQVQATFALIRKHKQYSASAVQTWQQGQADIAVGDPLSGNTRYLQRYLPGTILDVPEQTDYEFPSARVPADSLVAVLQAELRAVAARLVLPEYMLTSNAENANYASTLVAEAPAVKHFERLQRQLARKFGDGCYGGPGHCGALWRVLEYAVEWGNLPRAVLERVALHVEPPSPVARDKDKETARAEALNRAGVLSKATWSKWEGLDRNRERRLLEREKKNEPPTVDGKAFTEAIRILIERCLPHKTGRYVNTKIGYNPDKNNSNCHRGLGDLPADPPEPAAGHGMKPAPKYQEEKRASVFRAVYADVINSESDRPLAKSLDLAKEIVADGKAADIPESAVAEAAMAALLGHKLTLSGQHAFDTRAPAGQWRKDAEVLLDVKVSKGDKYTEKFTTKARKIKEYLNTESLPAYLVMAKGHGVYLHVGIDPAKDPKLQLKNGQGKRRVVEPRQLSAAITGHGDGIPLVKLADWDRPEAIRAATPEQVANLRQRVRTSLEGIDMKKLHKQVDQQRQAAAKGNIDLTWQIAPEMMIDKVAAEDPEATTKAGMKAAGCSKDQIEAVIKMMRANRS
jgi:hypothetical protein